MIFFTKTKNLPSKIIKNIELELKNIEKTKKKFGDLNNPLLVSVRSGARISMPGMMDTILNLGLNDKTVEALKKELQMEDLQKIVTEDLYKCIAVLFLGSKVTFLKN